MRNKQGPLTFVSTLMLDGSGNLYSTTSYGGTKATELFSRSRRKRA
jgi:hypothetical protein